MKKISEGYGRTSVRVNWLELEIGQVLVADGQFLLNVQFYYEDALEESEFEPPSEELFELVEVLANFPVAFSSRHLKHTVPANCNLLPKLSAHSVEEIITQIKVQCRGELKYIDPDSRRPEVNERAREELGWNLQGEYS